MSISVIIIIINKKGVIMLFDLFITFARIGAVTFGGGYAMLPLLQREIVENKKWASQEEIMEYYAIGQSTPGIIALNTSTFIGYKNKGIGGALAAVLGFITPSILIILAIANVLDKISHLAFVENMLQGIRVAVIALVLKSIYGMLKKNEGSILSWTISIAAFVLLAFFSLSPIFIVLGAGLAGLLLGGDK